jgi:hypothetical protein
MSTLKQIIDRVCDDAFFEKASSYATNTQQDYRRLVRYANKAVSDILTQHTWGALKRRGVINVVDGTTLYDLPDDFDYLINDTTNTRNGFRNVDLPASDEIVALNDTTNIINYMGRILGSQVEVLNAPVGELHYMYISNQVIQKADDSYAKSFTADTDDWLLDDELLVRGILWRWQKTTDDADWQTDLQDFTNYLDKMKYQDTGARTINADESIRHKYIPFWAKDIK